MSQRFQKGLVVDHSKMSMQGVMGRLGMEDSFEVDLVTWLRENRKDGGCVVPHIVWDEHDGIRGEYKSGHDTEEIEN